MTDPNQPLFPLPGKGGADPGPSRAYPEPASSAGVRPPQTVLAGLNHKRSVPAWMIAAGIALIAVIAAALAFSRSGHPDRDIAAAPPPVTENETASLPTSLEPRGDSEIVALAQLRRIADADRPLIKAELADLWVPQLSSKRPGIVDDGVVWDNARTLEEFRGFRDSYDAKLLWSGDWSTFNAPNFWVTIVPVTFNSSDGALQWCTAHGFDSWHCLAKLVSTTHPVAGSTALN